MVFVIYLSVCWCYVMFVVYLKVWSFIYLGAMFSSRILLDFHQYKHTQGSKSLKMHTLCQLFVLSVNNANSVSLIKCQHFVTVLQIPTLSVLQNANSPS